MTAGGSEYLTAWERTILDAIVDAAEHGRPAPKAIELQDLCGCLSISITVHIVRRLERKGLIRVERYQRSRRITIVSTGRTTAAVSNRTPHWRSKPRPASLPAPTLAKIRERDEDFARELMRAAREEKMEFGDFLVELVWTGWQARAAQIQAVEHSG